MSFTNLTKKTILLGALAFIASVFAHGQFSPADLSGMQLWVSADAGITLNGNFVSQWDDQSGNANHCTSEFDVIRPTLLTDAINGLPALSFDGSEDFMVFPLIDDVRTVFWVLRENVGATGSPPRPLLGWSGGLTYLRGAGEEFWDASFSDPAVHNGTTRLNFENINGTQTDVPNEFCLTSLVTTGPVNATHFTMELNIFGRTWWGEIAEVLIYNVPLSEAEVEQVEDYLADKYSPDFVAMQDVNVEYGFCDTLLCAPVGYTSYLWNNEYNTQCISVNAAGEYTLQMTDAFGRTALDTVQVSFPGALQIPNTIICAGETFLWDTQLNESDYTFLWSDNSASSSIVLTEENDYSLSVTDTNACAVTIGFTISVDDFSTTATLGADAQLCAGNSIGFTQDFEDLNYLWSTDEATANIIINTTGDYWLEATNSNNCVARDTIYIEVIGIAPEIAFDVNGLCEDGTTVFNGNNISLSNISTWQWNFGDAQEGSGQNIAHTYDAGGDYEVTLIATTVEGCAQTFVQYVHVNLKPLAQFTTSLSCDNEPIQFNDNSTSSEGVIESWQWLIDGIFYTGQEVQALIDESGFQNVLLSVTTEFDCTAEVNQAINVLASPVVSFVADATCEGELTQFSEQVDDSQSGAIQQYAWSFGDNTGSTLANPAHFYSQGNVYSVVLIVHAVNGCSDTLTQLTEIYELPIADFVLSNACQGQMYELVNSSTALGDSITTWNWEVNENIYTDQNPQVVFTETGLQPVSLSVTTLNGCTSSVQQQIPVWQIPIAAFSFAPEIGEAPFECQFINESSGATEAQWFFGDTYESTEYHPLHTFTLNGTAYTQLVAISVAGCRDTTGQIIAIAAPVFDVMIQTVQCTPSDLGQQITAQLINTGNITIEKLIVSYQVGNDAPVLEVWNGTLFPSTSFNYTFNAYMQLKGQQFPYVCITAETSPIEYVETNLTDNQYCKPLEDVGLEVFPPYPNPGDDRMFVRFITPLEGDLQLHVYDIRGSLVMDLEDEGVPKGYHQYFLDISALVEGNYKLQLEMNSTKSVVSFMKVKTK